MRENLNLSQSLLDESLSQSSGWSACSAEAGKFPSQLSGGMTKRVALARALALDPEIVFLDEPTSGLDPISASEFDTLIKTLQNTLGLTVFMVTHDLDSLHTVCNRVAALANGKIVEVGPIEQLVGSQHPWVRSYFQRSRTHPRDGEPLRELMESGHPIVLIGGFVLAVIAAAFGFVCWLHNTAELVRADYLRIHFENTVSGLLTGRLFSSTESRRRSNRARPRCQQSQSRDGDDRRSRKHAVRADTKVGLDFQGLTGVPVVTLQGGSKPLTGTPGQPATLTADPLAGQSMTTAARDALRRLDLILADNAEPLRTTIANLNTFSAALARNSDKLDSIVSGLDRLTGGSTANAPRVVYDLAAPKTFPPWTSRGVR